MRMRQRFTTWLLVALTGATLPGCADANDTTGQQALPDTSAQQVKTRAKTKAPAKTMKIRLKIGDTTLNATLDDNATAKAFKALLPLTAQMTELNGNEKYSRLSVNLPTNASNPGTIQTGDLMLYGQDTLVLFYETFPTSYPYTRLGRISESDTAALAAALGSGSVTVTYESQ